MNNKKKRKGLFLHDTLESIETQTIRKFIIIVGIILFLMWILEILFFNVFYENVRMKELYKSTDKILEIYTTSNTIETLNDYAFKNNINIIVSTETNKVIDIQYSTYGILQDISVTKKVHESLDLLGSTKDSVLYENKSLNTRIFFKRYLSNNQTYYIYSEIIYNPLTSTNEVFIRLLLLTSIVSFIIAMIFSYFLSKNLSDPILNISKKAKLLINGDLDVVFSSNEYEEVKQLSKTLNFAISEIKRSQILQKEVICNISHELKTPLTMIQSYAELINDINGDDKQKREENIAVILEEVKRLESLVDDIMQYSKLESGLIEYNYETFDLVRELNKLKEFYQENYSQKGFDISFDYYQEEVLIYADKNRIEQVVINLINNAINYSCEKKVIKIHLLKEEKFSRLVIRDYGMGISKGDLEHIFEKHFRSIGAKRVRVGSGIGLSICKSILNEHKFNFGVDSEVGKGSVFYVDFPFLKDDERLIIN